MLIVIQQSSTTYPTRGAIKATVSMISVAASPPADLLAG
jgi:hypothetical protein